MPRVPPPLPVNVTVVAPVIVPLGEFILAEPVFAKVLVSVIVPANANSPEL